MKLLLFSDIHCSIEKCVNLVTMSKNADIVIGAGKNTKIESTMVINAGANGVL